MMSGAVWPSPRPSSGSLLVAVTSSEPEARPERLSLAVTVATWTSRWFGGQRLHPGAGSPTITGGVLSIRMIRVLEDSRLPAWSVAEYVRVVVPSAVTLTAALLPSNKLSPD